MFINNTNTTASFLDQDKLFVVVQIRDDNTYYLTGYDKERGASWVTNNAVNRFSKRAEAKMITAALYPKRDAGFYAKRVNGLVISVKDIKRMRENK